MLFLQVIELKFEKFDVERDNYCRYDFVAVFNGGEINDAKRIGKYCGDSPPAWVIYWIIDRETTVCPFVNSLLYFSFETIFYIKLIWLA